MAFRADESAKDGNTAALNYLIPLLQGVSADQLKNSREVLAEIIEQCGSAVDAYPSWHPLVCNSNKSYPRFPQTHPSDQCGYKGLDHTVYFVNGFITCPYGNGQDIINSVNALPRHPAALITAERIDAVFYHPDATPILVRCHWNHESSDPRSALEDQTIPLAVALPLMLEEEIPHWKTAEVAETWETMHRYFLGAPHGKRSSLFVTQETGQAMKKIWESLISSGMFGPIRD